MKNISNILVGLVSVFVSSVSLAQSTVAEPIATETVVETVKCEKEHKEHKDKGLPFALDFTVDGEYFNFDDGVTAVTSKVTLGLTKKLDFSVALPVYNNTDETDFSDIVFDVHYTALEEKWGTFGVNAGIAAPLDGYFSSENTNYIVGADFKTSVESFVFTQNFSYLFAEGLFYSPDFGGFVSEDLVSADSVLSYSMGEKISVGAKFTQNYCDDSQVMTLGPVADFKVGRGMNLNVGVLFPVLQEDMPYGDNDFTISAGFGFKF